MTCIVSAFNKIICHRLVLCRVCCVSLVPYSNYRPCTRHILPHSRDYNNNSTNIRGISQLESEKNSTTTTIGQTLIYSNFYIEKEGISDIIQSQFLLGRESPKRLDFANKPSTIAERRSSSAIHNATLYHPLRATTNTRLPTRSQEIHPEIFILQKVTTRPLGSIPFIFRIITGFPRRQCSNARTTTAHIKEVVKGDTASDSQTAIEFFCHPAGECGFGH